MDNRKSKIKSKIRRLIIDICVKILEKLSAGWSFSTTYDFEVLESVKKPKKITDDNLVDEHNFIIRR